MFKLNFKENLKNIVNKEVSDVIDQAVDPDVISQAIDSIETTETTVKIDEVNVQVERSTSGPLYTNTYKELINLINSKTQQHLFKKQPIDNLFSSKSVITIFAFLLTSILVQLDEALLDKRISLNEGLILTVSLLGSVSTIAARGAEGSTGVYTPKSLPGLNKEDYDLDGVVNQEDETPFG
jgi:hypothetical protein